MDPHDSIEAVRTVAQAMAEIDTVDVPVIEMPDIDFPEELSSENIADQDEETRQELMDAYQDEKTVEITEETLEDLDIEGVSEWWEAWCEVRDILNEAFDGDVDGGDCATLTDDEPHDNMSVTNESINFNIDMYAYGDVHFIAEYAIDTESTTWEMLYEGFPDADGLDQINLGREVARAELAIIISNTKSAADTIDYWQTKLDPTGWNQKSWGDIRGVSRQTVNDRVRSAVDSLGD
jgi:hypothetical protein